jgi:hypothetical protein
VLRCRHRERRIRSHKFGKPKGDLEKATFWCEPMDQSDGQRFGRVDATTGQNEVLGARRADQPRQTLRPAPPRNDAELDLGQSELRRRCGNSEIAGKCDLGAATKRRTVDGGDEDAVTSLHGTKAAAQLCEECPNFHVGHSGPFLEIGARTERSVARSGEDHDPGLMSTADAGDSLFKLRQRGATDGVTALLAIDGPHLGASTPLVPELGHAPSLTPSRGGPGRLSSWMRTLGPALAVLALLGGLAHARVGGGQHYSSPSHSSPSHSPSHSGGTSHTSFAPSHSSGTGYSSAPIVPYSRTGPSSFQIADPLLILVFILLAIVLLVLLRRIFGASAGTQRALAERDAITQLDITASDREAWVAALQRRDPAFVLAPFLERVKSLFLTTQQAWSGGELVSVRRFLSDATWLRFRVQLALLAAQGVRNVTADMEVLGVELIGLEQNDWFDTVHVAVQARARDADVPTSWPDAKAHAAASHADPQSFTEVWSLVRKPGVVSRADGALDARTCPNCGAPFDGGAASTCTYCKAVVNSGAYDWVLAEITQAVEATRADIPVPGLESLRRRDPGLSLEVLEDRASLVFWRWVEAQSNGEPERLTRLSQPGPIERLRTDALQLAERQQRRVFLECAVGEVRVRAFEEAANRTLAHVEIRWSARTGVGPVGQTPPLLPTLPQRWVFTLLRSADATSRPEQGMSTDRCAQCGGPLGDELAVKCPWCEALLAGDLRDWTLAEACPLESWSGRASEGAAGADLQAPPAHDLEERERLLYIMAAMAMADGEVDSRERRLLMECAERWGLPPSHVEEALAAHPGALDTLLPDTQAGEPLLRSLALLASIDGRVDATERRMLESVASRLGLVQRLPSVLASVGAA